MNEEPTDAELETLATEIYWKMEHGEMREVVQRLRLLITEAQVRIATKYIREQTL